jgi:hypothetical protein
VDTPNSTPSAPAADATARPERRYRRLVIALSIVVLIGGCAVGARPFLTYWSKVQRKAWKEAAIPEITRLAANRDWLAAETARLENGETNRPVLASGWLTDRLILMENREWLVYKSHCSKAAPRLVEDIFLAKGSDGRWYYSTFHFCLGMLTLIMEQEDGPPAMTNLAAFAHEYRLREFDGKSDECLKKTGYVPASWAERNASNAVPETDHSSSAGDEIP